jgi:phage-related protein
MTARAVGSAFIDVKPRIEKGFAKAVENQVGPELTSVSERISGKMTAVGKGLSLGLTLPIVGAATAAITELGRVETIAAQTESVIKSTGGAAGVSSEQVLALADSIERATSVESESIQEGQNMLLTFKNITNQVGEGNDIFDQSTEALIDMSVAMGTEPSQAAIQLGKALNDPIAGISALSRVGITFTEDQKEMIKALVESGDVMGAQKIILAELNSQFGGSAEALGDTMVGRINMAKNAFGNMTETLAMALLPAIEGVTGVIQRLSDWFNNLSPAGQKMVGIFVGVAAAIGPVLIVGAKLVSAFGVISKAFTALRLVMLANPFIAIAAAVIALVTIIVVNWDTIKKFLVKTWETITRVATDVWNAIAGFFSDTWNTIKDTAARIWDGIKEFFKRFWPILLGIMTGGIGLVVGLIIKNWGAIKETTSRIWNGIVTFLSGIWTTIKTTVSGAWDTIVGFFTDAWEDIKTAVTDGIEDVIGFMTDLPGDILDAVGDVGQLLFDIGRDILTSLWDGLKDVWDDVSGWLSGIGSKIANLKGPPSADAKLLTDNGRLIFAGLLDGMREGWRDVEGFLGSRTVAIDGTYGGVIGAGPTSGGAVAGQSLTVHTTGDAEVLAREIQHRVEWQQAVAGRS